jgi:hypothetical protein
MPQYQGIWNLAQQAQALTRQQWVTDPLFDYTTLLLQADNVANGAQNNTFLDSSTANGGLGFPITRNGNTTQGTFSPFSQQSGYWGNYFGGSGNYVDAAGTAIAATTSTFTIEAWIYPTATPVTASDIPTVVSDGQAASTGLYWGLGPLANGKLSFYWYDGASRSATGNSVIPLNTWTHIAISVNSNAISLFVNGVLQTITGTSTLTNRSGTVSKISMGQYATTSSVYTGYISNLSILSGTAKYSSSFTPSPLPLPTNTTNQVFLFGYDNRFADANTATTAKTLTITGSPSVQAFSPFAPQYQYTPTVTGGSGYFDGTGDWLSVARNTAFIPTTGDFTVEMWIYPNSLQLATLIGLIEAGLDADWSFESLANGKVSFFVGSTTLSTDSTATYIPRQWNHIMACRSGGTLYVGVNGAANSATSAGSLNNSKTYPLTIGADQNGDERLYSGYISGVRFINGTALYASTTYTIPAAPLTAVTNTSLLCNFTNAGILDGTMKNNLETVGNAQVSTSVVKYGSGSMYFDGTGDYLRAPNSQNIAFGTGDFTIEMWLWFNATPTGDVVVIDARPSNTAVPWIITADATSGGTLYFYDGTTYRSTIPITPQAWMHFAVSRVNGTLRIFNNGVQGFSGTVTTSLNPTGSLVIGARNDGLVPFTGYMDDLRITKGIARYTRNFTPPQVALPRQ